VSEIKVRVDLALRNPISAAETEVMLLAEAARKMVEGKGDSCIGWALLMHQHRREVRSCVPVACMSLTRTLCCCCLVTLLLGGHLRHAPCWCLLQAQRADFQVLAATAANELGPVGRTTYCLSTL
jgi:hypothetical protein